MPFSFVPVLLEPKIEKENGLIKVSDAKIKKPDEVTLILCVKKEQERYR